MPRTRRVPKELVVERHYEQDSLGPAVSFRVVEYQIVLTIKSSGLLCRVIVPNCGRRIVAARWHSFADLGMSHDDL